MPACVRRALVVLPALVTAIALLAPATSAESRLDIPQPVAGVTSPVTASHVALSPLHKTIKFHHGVRLVAQVTSRFGAIDGEAVTWWARRPGSAWHRVRKATTDKHGRTTLTRHLRHTTAWQVRYAGDLLQDEARSKVATVKVLPPPPPPPPAPLTSFATRVVQEAAKHKGAPYQYGAAGPNTFDCSGFTMYVFGKFGVSLPHNAAAQYSDVMNIRPDHKRIGDLIFFYSSGGIYHVGIYAGHGEMWAATHTGDYVRLESIYSAAYRVGRVHAPR